MTKQIYPNKLKPGDEIRIIAPSFSMKLIPKDVLLTAQKRFEDMNLVVTFGKNTDKQDLFESSSVEDRLTDLLEAFTDKKVKGIVTAIGGYNANYLLDGIDWKIIENNPKVFCGFSDITVLANAIFAKTGLVTYSGPNFRNFGQLKYFDYSLEYFKKIIFGNETFGIVASDYWSDDKWSKDQNKRVLVKNDGWWVINEGLAEGITVGGNLCSLNLLQGTEYMPSLKGKILFVEDDSMSTVGEFSRNWQSLIHLSDFKEVAGVVIGRFQKKTKMTRKKLVELIKMKKELESIPVVANVDFGHTDPKITFPIGGEVKMKMTKNAVEMEILKH